MVLLNDILDHEKAFNDYVHFLSMGDRTRATETARKLKRYEFMVTFAPIPVEGGSGSPVNPLAVF